jgi:hypothetical protein
MKRLLLLGLLTLLPASASAQCNGIFPDNTVCGNVGAGVSRTPRPTNPSAFLGAAGGTNGQTQYNNGGALAGYTPSGDMAVVPGTGVVTIQPGVVSNSKLATGAANTTKGSLNGTTTVDIAVTACSVAYRFTQWIAGTGWSCGISPILPSRATAATLDLSAFSAITTQGYATPGDGGGATFRKIATQFLDSYVLTGTISNAGTLYTPGTYRSVFFSGGTGTNFIGNVVVGGGGTITSVTIINAGGFAFTVGDVLTVTVGQIGGTGSGFTYTVSTVSTPFASFTDSAGNKWQYVEQDVIYAKQFGAKFDWLRLTGDAGATNDQPAIQAALNYASYVPDAAVNFVTTPLAGTQIVWPRGTAMVCGSGLRQFSSTWARGQGPQNSVLKMCDAGIGVAENFYTVCDERAQLACFGGQITDFGLVALSAAPANANTFMLYSNAAQQQRYVSNVSIYSGLRGCMRYDTGYGGAAIVGFYDYFCTIGTTNTQTAANVVNATSTMFTFYNGVIEASSYTGIGINFLAGVIKFVGFHFEGVTAPINVQMPVTTDKLIVDTITGGGSCLQMVILDATNTPNNFSITQTHQQGACAVLVLNNQGGANRITDVPPGVFVNFNP